MGIIVGGAKRQKLVGSIPIGPRETFWSIIWCFKSKHIVQRVELLVKRRFDFLMDFESYVIYGLCACVILWKSLKLNRTNTLWVNSSTNLLLLPILMSPVSPTPSPLPTGLNSTHSIEERRFQKEGKIQLINLSESRAVNGKIMIKKKIGGQLNVLCRFDRNFKF